MAENQAGRRMARSLLAEKAGEEAMAEVRLAKKAKALGAGNG